jgi:predicted AAA+ superfamily ATPase
MIIDNSRMERSLKHLLVKEHFPHGRIAFVVGPRQVGKTTLARELLAARGSADLYRNWDDLDWRRALVRDPYGFVDAYRPKRRSGKPLVVLDEIHKYPRWKRYLKGLWDTRNDRVDVMVTGSGRLDVYQRGGDSLLGRYHQYRLHPLTVREVIDPASPNSRYRIEDTLAALIKAVGPPAGKSRDAFRQLHLWGGFPEPFSRQNERQLRLWHRERRNLIVREDLRDLTRIQLLSHVEELVEMLVLRAGSLVSYNSLREDLQVALDSVRLWTAHLIRLYFVFFVRPYSGKLPRALRKEPKAYLWDWSEIPGEGARFENMVASHLLKWCHFTQDWGYTPLELHYVRDREKREVDFLLTRDGKPWVLVEVKISDTDPGPHMRFFAARLGVKHAFLVVRDLKEPGTAGDVHVLDAASFLGALPV